MSGQKSSASRYLIRYFKCTTTSCRSYPCVPSSKINSSWNVSQKVRSKADTRRSPSPWNRFQSNSQISVCSFDCVARISRLVCNSDDDEDCIEDGEEDSEYYDKEKNYASEKTSYQIYNQGSSASLHYYTQ